MSNRKIKLFSFIEGCVQERITNVIAARIVYVKKFHGKKTGWSSFECCCSTWAYTLSCYTNRDETFRIQVLFS